LFATGLVGSTRKAYLLVQFRLIVVNGRVIRNPYKCLGVGDRFGVRLNHAKRFFKYYKRRSKRTTILQGIPNYIDFSLKIMQYRIFRKPAYYEIILPISFLPQNYLGQFTPIKNRNRLKN